MAEHSQQGQRVRVLHKHFIDTSLMGAPRYLRCKRVVAESVGAPAVGVDGCTHSSGVGKVVILESV